MDSLQRFTLFSFYEKYRQKEREIENLFSLDALSLWLHVILP